jgi:hypothetical protein
MNNSALINRIFILALFTGLASCGSETKSTEDASDEFAAAEEELKEKISSVIMNCHLHLKFRFFWRQPGLILMKVL